MSWLDPQIRAHMEANPDAKVSDLRVCGFTSRSGKPYSDGTLTAQRSRALKALGLCAPGNTERQARSIRTGDDGEAAAIEMLQRHGWTVEHVNGARRNAKLLDLRATKDGRTIEVQVKASRSHSHPLKQANAVNHLTYVIIDCREDQKRFYVVPGAAITDPSTGIYYRSPCGVAGRVRMNTLAPFQDAWHLL